MCTAITLSNKDFYFGRTLDLERNYGEDVVITPRNYSFSFRDLPALEHHYAIIGMAHVAEEYPLYYDAVNEAGLCMAGLNFVGFAQYGNYSKGKDNVACFELIPYILGTCRSVQDVCRALQKLQLTNKPFSDTFPPAQLHWIIADAKECITLEAMDGCIKIHENTVGVLTNNPPFDDQLFQLRNYMHLSPNPAHNHFSVDISLEPYSRGMGAIGLPGDLSSQSRFVRAAFTKLNSVCPESETVSQFFHVLGSVWQTRGCCRLEDGSCEITQYASCCNATRGIYYYVPYGNRRISAVDMHREDLEGKHLIRYPLVTGEDVLYLN